MTTTTPRALGALVLATILAAGACSSDDSSAADSIVLEAGPATTTDSPTSATASTPGLGAALESIVAETGVPALGAAVFDRDGLVDMAVSGVRRRGDTTEVTTDDLFHLGSNTKAMTATVLARLNEQDRGISFDTTLAEAFPDTTVDEGYAAVTLGQLLTHTGGAPGDDLDIDESILALPDTEGRALGADLVLSEPPAIAPGTSSSYSNAGYVIVGAAMEAATGESWERLMADEVFGPLGMESCGFGPPGTDGEVDQPSGHDASGEPVYWDLPPLLGPAGTVHCSMNDWGVFLVELLNGFEGNSDYLSQASVERSFEPAPMPVEGMPDAQSAAGWLVVDGPDGTAYYHNGSNTAWYSQAVILPDIDRVVLAVTNEERTGERATAAAFAATSELGGAR